MIGLEQRGEKTFKGNFKYRKIHRQVPPTHFFIKLSKGRLNGLLLTQSGEC